jgi:2,4-dienoyl-CoA reductase (NADPH2)
VDSRATRRSRWPRAIEDAGATLLNTGIGWHEARIPTIAQAVPRAGFAWAARRIKQAVGIPVVASNRINEPGAAEDILARGDADMVSLARALLADAEFANKAKAGDRAAINVCIACNQACLESLLCRSAGKLRSEPACRQGNEACLYRVPRRKRVAVVGGGPAGLSSAAVVAERGMKSCYSRNPRNSAVSSIWQHGSPASRSSLNRSVTTPSDCAGPAAHVVLNHAPKDSELLPFDEIVIATGIDPRRPRIPGIDDARVIGYADAIAGRVHVGESVAILGAGGIGFDVALYLLERSSRSTLDAKEFSRHWGISGMPLRRGGLDAGEREPARPRIASRC